MKFLKQVQAEMAKVVWPNKNTTALFTFCGDHRFFVCGILPQSF